MKKRIRIIALIAASTAFVSGLAIAAAPNASAIEGGQIERAHNPRSGIGTVLAQIWRNGNENAGVQDRFVCSGAVINEYRIITAAHCFSSHSDKVIREEYYARTGSTFIGGGKLVVLLRVDTRADIAILETGFSTETFLQGKEEWARAEKGQGVPAVKDRLDTFGFGRTCAGCVGPSKEAKRLQIAVNDRGARDSNKGPAFKAQGIGGRLWPGDSGGPVSVYRNNHIVLFGINSQVDKGNSQFANSRHSALFGANLDWAHEHGLLYW
jgi:hypothetical protein